MNVYNLFHLLFFSSHRFLKKLLNYSLIRRGKRSRYLPSNVFKTCYRLFKLYIYNFKYVSHRCVSFLEHSVKHLLKKYCITCISRIKHCIIGRYVRNYSMQAVCSTKLYYYIYIIITECKSW